MGPTAWGVFSPALWGTYRLTYSFPWPTSTSLSVFATDYSDLAEHEATDRFGLTAVQQMAFEQALKTWANVANVSFTRINETSTSVGEVRVAFSSGVEEEYSGHAYYPNNFYAQGGDIWLSPKITSRPWDPNNYNFSTLVHEIGHALGLSHPNDDPQTSSNLYTILSYVDAPNSTWISATDTTLTYRYIQPQGPQLHDILAIQYLYGPNLTYNSGNNTYTFDPATPFFKTIWDAGGTDTISAANFVKPVTINLNAGAFSSLTIDSIYDDLQGWNIPPKHALYDGTNNLAIAYGVTIENATGGAGNDKLIGNSARNRLDGGQGADELVGGEGYDSFVLDSALDRVVETPEITPAGVDVMLLSGDTYLRLQQFYIAYYGRPADYFGSVYWANTLEKSFKGDQTGMVAAFGNLQQAEYASLYGTSGTVEQFISRVYQNLFNRSPDQEGLGYWSGVIHARSQQVGVSQARSESVIQILDGAQTADKAVVAAKITVATEFSKQVSQQDSSNEYGSSTNTALFSAVRAWLSEIDATSPSVLSPAQIRAASVAVVETSGTALGDSVFTSVDWARTSPSQQTADIENFFATGTRALAIVGDAQTNLLSGNGHGSRLTGGAGADVFWFDEKSVTTPDRILDFNPDEDLIVIDGSLFIGLNKGPLSEEAFDAKFRFDGKTLYLANQPLYEITLSSGSFSYSDVWVF